jgi:hexosaminidase
LATAIGNSHPELLSKCSNGVLSEPLNATNEAVYEFVFDLYDEITLLFADEYIHLGGDEGIYNWCGVLHFRIA